MPKLISKFLFEVHNLDGSTSYYPGLRGESSTPVEQEGYLVCVWVALNPIQLADMGIPMPVSPGQTFSLHADYFYATTREN